jgi:hemerythrin
MNELTQLQVAPSVFWVEAPEADLRILCGCPEDAVKHLKQRGLIRSTEKDGKSFQTGPNAILLSDLPLQQGSFSNLAEFPALQMLYFQGMILPGHPNNTGVKPLLIGTTEQIKAQMAYIYRGNYGLVDLEELREAGLDEKDALEIHRMKLGFAFGRFRHSEELLDSLALKGNEWVEIRNQVYVRRVRQNVFEFAYRDHTVTVDINLPPVERNLSPYPLEFHDVGRDYFSVVHSGQGDGWDVNRPSMSSVLIFQGKVYLIDAGPNVMYSLTALGIGVNEVEGVFHTHCHDDHFAGLTTLFRSDHRLKSFATPLVRRSIFKKLSALLSMPEGAFSNYFDFHDLVCDSWNDIDGLEVLPSLSPHPVETTIMSFRVLWNEQPLTYAHLADISSLDVLRGMVTEDASAPGITADRFEKTQAVYLKQANLKKIDIGGGMIHGCVEDFAEDKSERIIVAHKADPLTLREKALASSAPFGVTDVLIPDYADNLRRTAYEHLKAYFPDAPRHQIRKLMNNEIATFKPGTILLRPGEEANHAHLLMTGYVERISAADGLEAMLSSGGIIGEHEALHSSPAEATYRTVSYAKTLCLRAGTYRKFIKENEYLSEIERLYENLSVLASSWLFSEVLTPPVQNRVAKAMILHNFPSQEPTSLGNLNPRAMYLVKSGSVGCLAGDQVVAEHSAGDFFGEEAAVFGCVTAYTYRTAEPTSLYEIPADVLRDIPIVLWKILETSKKRVCGGITKSA